jgi:hypothetical protein
MMCSNDCTTGKFGNQLTSSFHIFIQVGLWIGIKEVKIPRKNIEKNKKSIIKVLDALHGGLYASPGT